MKKILLATVVLASAGLSFAQTSTNEVVTTNELGQTIVTATPVDFRITPPMTEWAVVEDGVLKEKKEFRNNFKRDGYLEAQNATDNDPVVQEEFGSRMNRAPIVNFTAQSGSGYPPDPSGAAGPNHYVQAVNTSYRVYNKSGNAMTSSMNLSSLWPGSSNFGDPIVMYDRHADRWFISQFQANPNQILIAISTTGDPTGTYYAYTFNLASFPDYPKYSIWWDGYYMTSNSQHTAVVFERDVMLAGGANPKMISLSLPSLNHGGFRSPLPADADGALPPNGTPCYFFNLEDNAFSGVSQDQIEIYEMTTNWSNTSASQVVSSQQLPVPAMDAVFSGGFSNISQPGTSQKLDAIQGVLMYRAQHMRWTGYNTIVLSHAVDMGSNRSAVRWYELRDTDNGVWSVYQSGTYAPDNVSRWMSSAAMDEFGNIGMAYSVCDATTTVYPGLRYTGRLNGDPLGQMTLTEESAIEGSGSQTVTDRYGDYAHISLDPDGETFWYTGEFLATGGGKRTRVFSFSVQDYANVENPFYDNLEMTILNEDNQITVNANGVFGGNDVQIDLIGMDGRVISTADQTPQNESISHTFNTSDLGNGIYFVRIGNSDFQKAKRILIND